MSEKLFQHAVREWLEDGSDRTPRPAIDAVLLAVKATPQERDLRIPRRFMLMPPYMRLAAGIALVAVLGAGALLISRGPVVGPSTPTPTASPAAKGCGGLIPTLLMAVGCTYESTVFAHPLSITPIDLWLVGNESARAVSFQGYARSVEDSEVTLLVLGSVADGGCMTATEPLPSAPLPRTADEYIAWVRGAAPEAVGPVSATVGGLPAMKLTIPTPDADCRSITLGSTAQTPGAYHTLLCSSACTLYVIDDGGRILLLQTVLRAFGEGSDPLAVERFLAGLRLAP